MLVGVTYKDIDAILYTHIHPDHCADLVPIIFACKYHEDPRHKDLLIVGGEGFRDYFEGMRWVNGSSLEPSTFRIHIRELAVGEIRIDDLNITAFPLQHTPQSVGYRITSPEGKAMAYSGDTDYCPNLLALAKGADLLLLECSFPDEKKVPGHLTPSLAGRIAQAAGCKRLVLTHLYPPCDKTDIKMICQKQFSGDIIVAEDMMCIDI